MLKVEGFEMFINTSWKAVACIISESLTFKMSTHPKAEIKKTDNIMLWGEGVLYLDIGSAIGTTP